MITFSHSRKGAGLAPAANGTRMDFKFTQTGKYLIAAGSERRDGQEYFRPLLYISVVGDKGWASQYPLDGKFARDEEAAAAALHYGIRILNRQVRDVPRPGDPRPLAVQQGP